MGIFADIMRDQAETLTGLSLLKKSYTVFFFDYMGDACEITVKATGQKQADSEAQKDLAAYYGWGNYQINSVKEN